MSQIKLNTDDYKSFKWIDEVELNTESEYYLLCSNINSDDNWVWKWCEHEFNWTPIFSIEYGECKIQGINLKKSIKNANEWLVGISERYQHLDYQERKKKGIILPIGQILKININEER